MSQEPSLPPDANSNPPSNVPEQKPVSPQRPRRRRWPFVLLACLLLLVLLVTALMPRLASTSWGRSLVLSFVNRDLNGKVEVSGWSLSWRGGTALENLRVVQNGQPILGIGRLRTDLSVWDLLRGNYLSLGRTEVQDVDFHLVQYPDGTTNFERLQRQPSKPTDPDILAELEGDFSIRNLRGRIERQPPQGPTQVVLVERGTLNATIDDINAPIKHDIDLALRTASAPEAPTGALLARGTLKAFDQNRLALSKLSGHERLEIRSLDSSILLPFLGATSAITQLQGVSDGQFTIQLTGDDQAFVEGSSLTKDLAIGGPALQGDTYRTSQLAIQIPRLALRQSTGRIGAADPGRQITINADQGSAKLTIDATPEMLRRWASNLPPGGTGQVASTLDLDIAKLAGQLPHLLRLRPGMKIESGQLHQELTVAFAPEQATVRQQLGLSNLSGRDAQGQLIKAQPIALNFSAQTHGGGGEMPDLRQVSGQLTSGFAQVKLAGQTLAEVALDSTVNLTEMQREVGQFVDFGTLQLTGQASTALKFARNGSGLSAKGTLSGQQLAFSRGSGRYGPKDVSIKLDGRVDFQNNQPRQISLAQFEGDLGIGQVALVKPIVITNPLAAPVVAGTVRLDGQIQSVTSLLEALEGVAPGSKYDYAGAYETVQRVDFTSGRAGLLEGDLRLKNLTVGPANAPRFAEHSVSLANNLSLNAANQRLLINNLALTMPGRDLSLVLRGGIRDYANQRQFENVRASLSYDAARLLEMVHEMLTPEQRQMLDGLSMTGKTQDREFIIAGRYPAQVLGGDGKERDPLRFVRVSGSLLIDRVAYKGMASEAPLELPVDFRDGRLQTVYGERPQGQQFAPPTPFSGGRLDLSGFRLALLGNHVRVSALRPNHKLLDNVRITPRFVNDFLGALHPIFSSTQDARGTIHLTIEELVNLPLDEALSRPGGKAAPGLARFSFALNDLALRSPMIVLLASQMQLKLNRDGSLPSAIPEARFVIRDGLVQSNLQLDLGGQTLAFKDGRIRLSDRRILALTMDVPKAMIPGVAKQEFIAPVISVPVEGTLARPSFNIPQAALNLVNPMKALDLLQKEGDRGSGLPGVISRPPAREKTDKTDKPQKTEDQPPPGTISRPAPPRPSR